MVRAKNPQLCVYCGVQEATTSDHVVPKCLFPKPLPAVMVTVPACRRCNEDKARDDDYLRDMLVIDIDNVGHPITDGLLKGKVARAAARNQSILARDVRERSKLVPVHTPGGVYLGHCPAVPLHHERINREFERITRGLYFQLYRQRLPDDCTFDIRRVDRLYRAQAIRNMLQLGVKQQRSLGQVFVCMTARAAEDPTATCWLQRYFNVFITVSTNLDKQPTLDAIPKESSLTSWLG